MWRYLNPGIVRAAAPIYQGTERREYAPTGDLKSNPALHLNTLRRQLLGSEMDTSNPAQLRMGDAFLTTVTLLGQPEETEIGMMDRLLHRLGQANFYLMIDFLHERDGEVQRNLKRAYRTVAGPDKKGEVPPDPTDSVTKRALEKVVEQIKEGGDHVFKLGVTVLLMGSDLKHLHYLKEIVVSEFSTLGGRTPLSGTVQNPMLYLDHLLPFGGGTNPHLRQVLERNGADFFAFSAPWKGSADPMLLFTNRWGNFTALDLFDPEAVNHNGLIAGTTRSGKSYLAQSLVLAVRARGGFVAVIDRGGSYLSTVEVLGGSPVLISPDISINPFELEPGESAPSSEQTLAIVATLRTLLPDPGGTRGKIEGALMLAALEQTYARHSSERTDPTTRQVVVHSEPVYLSSFRRTLTRLERLGDSPISEDEKKVARELAVQLEAYCGDTLYGRFLDRPTSLKLDSDLLYFELGGLKDYPELETVSTLLIARMIWARAKSERARKKLLIFDEVWALFLVEEAKKLILSLYREGGKYGLFTYAIAQSIKDFTGFTGLVENASYYFIGRVKNDDSALETLLKLPPRTVRAMSTLNGADPSYREFLVCVDKGTHLVGDIVQNRTSRLEGWMFSSNPQHDAQRRRAIAREGDILGGLRALAKEG